MPFPSETRSFLVVEEQPSASGDFYIRPLLARSGVKATWLSLAELPHPSLLDGAFVVLVRYCNHAWISLLRKHRDRLAGLALFIDDDLADLKTVVRASGGLSVKWFWKGWRHVSPLLSLGAELWVSTPYLQEKYADRHPVLVPPQNPYRQRAPFSPLKGDGGIFYHGSQSHRAEISWLRPVVEEVLARCPGVHFELLGDRWVQRLYGDLERVQVIPYMSWPHYKQLIAQPGRIIGLAPVLPNVVNNARAGTRFFDVTAAGAVGIYSCHPAYEEVVRHEGNGLLLPMDRKLWVDSIVELVNNPDLRRQLYERSLNLC